MWPFDQLKQIQLVVDKLGDALRQISGLEARLKALEEELKKLRTMVR